MRVLITGGRDFADRDLLVRTLDRLHETLKFTLLIHGDAKGADRLAGEWAVERHVQVLACPANWKKYGRGAGPMRNRQMLEKKPDLLIAFPGGKGTADMVQVAREAGLRAIVATEVEQAG